MLTNLKAIVRTEQALNSSPMKSISEVSLHSRDTEGHSGWESGVGRGVFRIMGIMRPVEIAPQIQEEEPPTIWWAAHIIVSFSLKEY